MMNLPIGMVFLSSPARQNEILDLLRNLSPAASIPLLISGIALLTLLILWLRRLPSRLRARKHPTLSPIQLEELLAADPPQIIDLRSRKDFYGKKGHIRGAINIPVTEIRRRMEELDTSLPRPIVLVAENDIYAHGAVDLLKVHGHQWIYVLEGGYQAWRRAKLPTYHTPETHR